MTYPATRELAKRIAAVHAPDIGDAARAGARNAALDTLGVILAGRDDDCARLAHRLAASEGGVPVARLIGAEERTSASWAAFVNGTAGHALDYDDVDFVLLGHPSVTLVPALIALAEERGIGGAKVLEAYAVGFELLHVLGRAVNPLHYRRGFHATATLGSVGVAGACAYLLGLDEAQTRNALSLGASGSAGLVANFGTMTKPFHAGQSARAGLVAAKLAEEGFTAAEDTLETGFTAAMAAEGIGPEAHEFADWESAVAPWGQPWDIEAGVCVKIHPCCAMTHPGIDAMLDLVTSEDVRVADVAELGARASTMTLKVLRYKEATTGLEGKFSMPFCIASALVDRKVGIRQFEEDSVARPEIAALQKRVAFELDEKMARDDPETEAAEVWVKLKDGRELTRYFPRARGHVENPLTEFELREKFLECAAGLTEEKARAAWDAWYRLDAAEDVASLTAMLAEPVREPSSV